MSGIMALSTTAITKSYLKDLKTEVKNRRRSKLLRKKVLRELKKTTPTVKPVKTKIKSKQALKKLRERAEAKELASMFRDSERLAEKLASTQAKAAEKAAKKLAATQAKAAEKALKAKAKAAEKAAKAEAKKLAAKHAKFAKKAIALLKFAQANNYTIEDIVAELKAQVEPSRSDNFVTIIDSENNINM